MNLHDELGRHGADAVAGSASRLESGDVRASLGERVRRGRRRRAVGGGVGAVAGVALVVVGVWGVLPGGTFEVAPAGPSMSGGVTYSVDGTAEVDKIMPVDLRVPSELHCGVPVDLRTGVTVHEPEIANAGFVISAKTELVHDDGSRFANPTSVWAGYEAHNFVYEAAAADLTGVRWYTTPMLLKDGWIVGLGTGTGGAADGEMTMSGPETAGTPLPGECDTPQQGLGDGMYEPVLVTQLWSASLVDPLATIVHSAGDVEYTGLGSGDDQGALGGLGSTWGDDGLVAPLATREWTGGLECSALLSDEEAVTDLGADIEVVGSIWVPSTIETGRLYGYGDDALVGGYPIPIGGTDDGTDPVSRMAGLGETRLLLRGDDEVWVFNARWMERDDLPHDEPGWFVELSQVWDCGNPDLIEPGDYYASLVVPSLGEVYDLTPIQVVVGVPSIPEIHGQG